MVMATDERVFSDGALTPRRELREIFWVNPRQLQESSHGYVKKLPDGRYEVCCKGQHVEVKNRNGRIYPLPTWARHLMPGTYFESKISGRRCVGQVEHPQTGRSSMDKGAIVITKAWIDQETGILWIVFETMSTPHGKIVAAYLDDSVGFGVSSRGNGSTMNNGEADIVQEDFEPVTWDTVLDESTPGAEIPAEMAMQAEARARLSAWAVEQIQAERKKILAESHGNEAAAVLLARTTTERMLVECFGGVCTIKRTCSCEAKGVCSCSPSLTEGVSEDVLMPKGYNEYLLPTPDETGHYRAYDDGKNQWDVWLMIHNLKPEKIASSLLTMFQAKAAAENHLQHILAGRGTGGSKGAGTPYNADGDFWSDGEKAPKTLKSKKVTITVGEQANEAKIQDKFHVSGSSVYLHQFDSEDEAKKAAKALHKAGFLGVEYRPDDGMVCVHTGYDSEQQACDHIRRVLDNMGVELDESVTVVKKNKAQEGVQEFSEELRQAKDAKDDVDVPTYAWVGGSMVKPAQNKGKNENYEGYEARRAYEMGMMAGYMAELGRGIGRTRMGEQGGDPAQGYPNDYPSDNNKSASPSMQGYPPTSSPAPAAVGGYPGHPGHAKQDYPGFESYSAAVGVAEIKRQASRDPSVGAGYYEDGVPSQGWSGDYGHPPHVGPTAGQMAGPQTHPLQTTKPGFGTERAYEMGMMAGRMQANYGDAPLLYPWSDDIAMMLGYGFEATGHSPAGGPQGVPIRTKEPKDPLDTEESGYLGYAPILDDPEDLDLDLDVNDPVLDIDQADTGPSPYDVDSTDTVYGYSEATLGDLVEKAPKGFKGTVKAMKGEPGVDNPYALAHWMKGKGYTSHRKASGAKKEESTMRPGASPQAFGTNPSYAFKTENRTSGSFVKFYFNEGHKLVEVREFDKQGTLLQRHGFVKPGSGAKVESTASPPDPKTIPASVHETIKKVIRALGNGTDIMRVFAEQAAKVPPYDAVPGVDPSYELDPDKQRAGSADKAKKDAGGGAPGGSATTSTTQAERHKKGHDDDDDDDEKDESTQTEGEKKDDDEDEKDESRLDPKPQKELHDALAEIETLKGANDQLTKLIEQMTILQQKKDVQHRLESVLRESPELKRLKHKLEVCESVEALEQEAQVYLEAIHEASGYRPTLPGLDEQRTSSPPPTPGGGRDTAGKTSASSTKTSGAPMVGVLAEGVSALPALGGNGSGAGESKFSRVKEYRENRGRRR